jgi:hypothetical protein
MFRLAVWFGLFPDPANNQIDVALAGELSGPGIEP